LLLVHQHQQGSIPVTEDMLATRIKANEPLTPREVCTVLRVSSVTVTRLIHAGELKATRVGGQWRIWPSDLLHYIRKHLTAVSTHLDELSR
jgi:excisionase family DNA binding protein